MRQLCLWGLCVLLSCGGCGKTPKEDSAFFMGTFIKVTAHDARAFAIVFEEFRRLDKVFNIYDRDSELSQLNRTGEMVVSDDLFQVLKMSREFYQVTSGAFDVSVAPLALLWKQAIQEKALPADDDIAQARSCVGMDYVYLDDATRRVKLLKEGVQLDLGALAKGYAVDRAIARLKEAEISSVLVNAGGEVYCLGDNASRPWQVAIRDPRQKDRVFGRMDLRDQAAATSGDYEQYFELNGQRYSHIIDPRTGYPAQKGAVAATIVSSSAATADALATSCLLLEPGRCRDLLSRYPEVRATLVDEHGKISTL